MESRLMPGAPTFQSALKKDAAWKSGAPSITPKKQ
jgi:hypothetical protein